MFSFIHKWLWVWCLSLNICNSDVLVAIGTLQFFYFQFFKFPRIVNILYYNTQKLRCFNLSAWKDWKVPRQIFVINCFQHYIPEKDIQYLFLHVFKLLRLLNLNIHFACLKLTKKKRKLLFIKELTFTWVPVVHVCFLCHSWPLQSMRLMSSWRSLTCLSDRCGRTVRSRMCSLPQGSIR